ncbi:MAG: DUF5916 domain-containing protein [Chitinophagales bacterium]
MRITVFIIILLSFVQDLSAQGMYQPFRTENEITLDGKFSEPDWNNAPVVTEFIAFDPVPGEAPSQKTEVRMIYSDEFLFIGITCFDTEPEKLIIQNLERDANPELDDGVAVIIDSYNDKTNGITFASTAGGNRYDEQISNNGTEFNNAFNTFWDVKTSINEAGYTIEYRIPFSSLRFEEKEEVVMGFKVVRLIKRNNEYIIHPPYDISIDEAFGKLSLAAEMVFNNLRSKTPLYIIPYISANYTEQNLLNADSTAYEKESVFMNRKYFFQNETLDRIASNIGIDVKYGITKNFTLDLTLNTDFAQAEADDRIINLTKYDIDLPEKRSFFLESADYLNFGIGRADQMFTSRNIGIVDEDIIVPIIGGVRLTGKANGWQLGALNMTTKGLEADSIDGENFSVLRLRKDIKGNGSHIGGLFTNKFSTADPAISNQEAAFDITYRFNEFWETGFRTAITFDDADFSDPFNSSRYNGYFVLSSQYGYSRFTGFGIIMPDFNPEMGFLETADIFGLRNEDGWSFEFEDHPVLSLAYFELFQGYRSHISSGKLESASIGTVFALEFNKGAEIDISPIVFSREELTENWNIGGDIIIPMGYYNSFFSNGYIESNQVSGFTWELDYLLGGFFGGNTLQLTPVVNYIINKNFRFGIEYDVNTIVFPSEFSASGETNYFSQVFAGNFNFYFSSAASLKILAQFDDISNTFGGNVKFRYNPREGTDLYIVWNQNLNTLIPPGEPALPALDSQGVTVKFVHTISL